MLQFNYNAPLIEYFREIRGKMRIGILDVSWFEEVVDDIALQSQKKKKKMLNLRTNWTLSIDWLLGLSVIKKKKRV